MATALSDEFRDLALELVTYFGKAYKIARRTTVTPDACKPTNVTIETQEWDVMAALTSFTEEQIKFLGVTREDFQVVVAWNDALPANLLPGDLFLDGDKDYTIIPPETVYSVNGVTVAWQLLVRR